MQSLGLVATADLLAKVKTILQKFEVYVDGVWVDINELVGSSIFYGDPYSGDCEYGALVSGGVGQGSMEYEALVAAGRLGDVGGTISLLKSVSVQPSGAGKSAEVIAGTWSAEIHNPGGVFHPLRLASSYHDYFRIGREARISLGGVFKKFPAPLEAWLSRKRIDLPIPDANLMDFPNKVPIVAGSPASIAIGAACRADGFDIRFTKADGVTLLKYERESFVVSGGEATGIFWVKSDVSTAGTYIWCYFGNAAASDVSEAVGTQWTVSGQCVVDSKTQIRKVGGSAAWDSQGYSAEGYTNACVLSFQLGQTDCHCGMGLNSDPATDATESSIDYFWFVDIIGRTRIFENQSDGELVGTYTVNTVFRITYDGVNIKYYLDSVLKRTTARAIGAALYIDSSFNNPGAIIKNIVFGPSVEWVAYGVANWFLADGGLTWGAEEVPTVPNYSKYWQRLIGYMDEPRFDHGSRTASISGLDYTKRLADTIIRASPLDQATINGPSHWGKRHVTDSKASYTPSGAELYDKGDALDPVTEAGTLDAHWETLDANSIWEVVDAGGGIYFGKYREDDGGSGWVRHPAIAALTKDAGYIFKFKYRTPGGAPFQFELAQTIAGQRRTIWTEAAQSSAAWVEKKINLDAEGTVNLEFKVIGNGVGNAYMEIDWISLKAGALDWNVYPMPSDCNGPYWVTLNGEPVYQGDAVKRDKSGGGWFYDEITKYFYFDKDKSVLAGTDNLKIYYYTTQNLDNVTADLLVAAGYYANRAAALAAMDYTPTGLTIPRVWFEKDNGMTALAAVKLVCERADYRFWFAYDGMPTFKPAPVAGAVDFSFTSFGHLGSLDDHQDLGQIRNRIIIEGIEQGMFATREEKKKSRLTGEAYDQPSIDAYLEHTEPIQNHLFQDQAAIDAMCATLLAARKDPKWYASLTVPHCVVPLEIGDCIEWDIAFTPGGAEQTVTGIIVAVNLQNATATYNCEVIP